MINPALIRDIYKDIREKNPEIVLQAFSSEEAKETFRDLLAHDHPILDTEEKLDYAVQEMVGLGVIDSIIKQNKNVTDVSFNGSQLVIKRSDLIDPYPYEDPEGIINEDYIIKIIQKFANAVEKDFTTKHPDLNASLGRLRINALHKSHSPDGTTMAIRVHGPKLALTKENFSDFAPEFMYEFFKAAVGAKANIVIAGETGSGKTEFQKFLLSMIPFREKIVWIEDTMEGHLKELFGETKDIHSWLTSPKLSINDLVKNALRNDPKWICVAETRGMEAYEMYQAVLSSHSIITTLHANDAETIPSRLINMMKMGYKIDEKSILKDIYKNFHLGVHLKTTAINGKTVRYLGEVAEYNLDGSIRTIFKQRYINGKFERTLGEMSQDLKDRMLEHQVDLSVLPVTVRGE